MTPQQRDLCGLSVAVIGFAVQMQVIDEVAKGSRMNSSLVSRFSVLATIAAMCVALAFALCPAQIAHAAQGEASSLTATSSSQGGVHATAKKGWLEAWTSNGSYTWSGKVKKPKVEVDYCYWNGKKDIYKKLKAGRDYKLTYPKSTKTGEKLIKVVGRGAYAGMKTYARYYIIPCTRKITSCSLSGNTLKLNWETHPDGTSHYVFSIAPTAAAARYLVENYSSGIFDGDTSWSEGKWGIGRYYTNNKIKSTWGAGHAKLDVKKYRSNAYKKNYVYVCIAAVKIFDPKLDLDGLPILISKSTVKKVKISKLGNSNGSTSGSSSGSANESTKYLSLTRV